LFFRHFSTFRALAEGFVFALQLVAAPVRLG